MRPLAGITVLDLGIITAGAATAALLVDLGATVVKIESEGYRDPFRDWVGGAGQSPLFNATNRGKHGLALDLKHPEGRGVFLDLAEGADVVVENFRRGVLDKLGLGFGALRARNPAIVLASISSQGETGPDAGHVSYGSTLESVSGLAFASGYAGGGPEVSGVDYNYPDQVVAIFAAGMIVSALMARRAGGGAAHLDLSQRELTSFLMGEVFAAELSGQETRRRGNAEAGYAMQDCLATRDGWLAVSVPPGRMAALGAVAGPDLPGWAAGQDAAAAAAALAGAGIAAAPVANGMDILRARPWHRAMTENAEGALVKGQPFRFRSGDPETPVPAPAVGRDSRRTLAEIAGYGPERIDRLIASGAVSETRDEGA